MEEDDEEVLVMIECAGGEGGWMMRMRVMMRMYLRRLRPLRSNI